MTNPKDDIPKTIDLRYYFSVCTEDVPTSVGLSLMGVFTVGPLRKALHTDD